MKILHPQNTSDFTEEYLKEAAIMKTPPSLFYAPLTYDAVWSMALALNSSLPLLPSNQSLHNFTYERKDMTDIFMDEMHNLHFEGMTVNPKLSVFHTSLKTQV